MLVSSFLEMYPPPPVCFSVPLFPMHFSAPLFTLFPSSPLCFSHTLLFQLGNCPNYALFFSVENIYESKVSNPPQLLEFQITFFKQICLPHILVCVSLNYVGNTQVAKSSQLHVQLSIYLHSLRPVPIGTMKEFYYSPPNKNIKLSTNKA